MDKKLQEIQRQLRQEKRGRLWRPRRELRQAIEQWAAEARGRGLTWRDISTALTIDKDKRKSWRQQAVQHASQQSKASLAMVPVAITEASSNTSGAMLVIVRGASMAEIAALLERL